MLMTRLYNALPDQLQEPHAEEGNSVALLQVLVRGRLHAVRGKGKSAFLVVRQGGAGATVQAVMFVDDKTVSKVRGHAASLAIPHHGQAPGSNGP
jgi:aspartyl/asparaginyl-tRNA synthetase